jgi:alpha-glucosidase
LVQLALPGACYVYQGDELGLENVDLPDEALQDPTWERSGHTDRGRDGERVPLPWSGSQPPYGFSSGTTTWLPMPPDWAPLTVTTQQTDPSSTLSLYRAAIGLRRSTGMERADFSWLPGAAECLCFRRGEVMVLLNAGRAPVERPAGELLLASGPVDDSVVPGDTVIWLRI